MICPNCGNNVPDDKNFCVNCGAALRQAAPQQAPQAAPQAAPAYSPQAAPQAPAYPPQAAPQAPAYPPQAAPQQPYAPQGAPQQAYAPQPQPVYPQAAPQQPYAAQPQPQYAVYNNVVYNQVAPPPVRQLATNRKLVKYIFFSMLTLGIYSIVYFTNISTSLNAAASRYDGRKTMNYCLVFFVFSWLTLGIVPFVWMIKMSSRVGSELQRRGIAYSFGAGQFWLWYILGSLFIAGPFIYIHKLSVSMNLICQDYNLRG